MRAKRRELTAEDVKEKSAAICERLFDLEEFNTSGAVALYMSSFNEPRTDAIIKRLRGEGRRAAVPVTDVRSGTLMLAEITENTRKGAYGIPEPAEIIPVSMEGIEIILVPGLAFDETGARMGFGKGYYDKLLQKSGAVKIGLCYDFQLLEKIPSEPHDVPMDIIITEKRVQKGKNYAV